jgi:2-polyprenyl-3-methyl-5-hydroxy-6-metoxy-1,4-benzoquinol methylase
MNNNTENIATYDNMFKDGGYAGVYDLPSNKSWYYPLYKKIISEIKKTNGKKILEVGCGTGAFAELILKYGYTYKGFDFSEVAVKKAALRTGIKEIFYQGDALAESSYNPNYDMVVCTEVLEHIEDDLGAISLWKKGAYIFCSVPNYDAPGQHVRFFQNTDQVLNRYSPVIDIKGIFKLKKPFLVDISLKNYLRNIKWSRYDLKKLRKIFGLCSFEDVGGWFVFSGVKR